MKYSIAIDGPAGVGKSTVSTSISKLFNILHLNTGLMYRSISFLLLDKNLDIYNENNIKHFNNDLYFKYEDFKQKTFYLNNDISLKLKSNLITNFTSKIATIKYIREYLVNIQRNIAINHNIIMDGRDIGTVVLPKANLKIYLNANIVERTKRRYLELKNENFINFEKLKNDIEKRDFDDKNRDIGPLIIAKDAIEIDTTNLNLNEVIKKVSKLVNKKIFNIH